MLALFSARICPFAQRTRALLAHLEVPFELEEMDLGNKSSRFLALSPTGKVPLLVDGDLALYESAIINEYLAEKYAWAEALPPAFAARARVRLAMKQWDEVVNAAYYQSLKRWGASGQAGAVDNPGAIEKELDELERTLDAHVPSGPSLCAFHLGPFWQRMVALPEASELPALVRARPALAARLDGAASLPTVAATGVAPERLREVYQALAKRMATAG